jgi:hypothetical protein
MNVGSHRFILLFIDLPEYPGLTNIAKFGIFANSSGHQLMFAEIEQPNFMKRSHQECTIS